jgi:hypothetical protein
MAHWLLGANNSHHFFAEYLFILENKSPTVSYLLFQIFNSKGLSMQIIYYVVYF